MSEAAVKKYVVRLSAEERQTLAALISKGKHPAAQVLKAGFCSRPTFPRRARAGATAAS